MGVIYKIRLSAEMEACWLALYTQEGFLYLVSILRLTVMVKSAVTKYQLPMQLIELSKMLA